MLGTQHTVLEVSEKAFWNSKLNSSFFWIYFASGNKVVLIELEPRSMFKYQFLLQNPTHTSIVFLLFIKFFSHDSWFFTSLSTQNILFIIFSGISDSYQMGIFRILAGILHLGNVEFAARDSDSCTIPVSSRWAQERAFSSGSPVFCLFTGISPGKKK